MVSAFAWIICTAATADAFGVGFHSRTAAGVAAAARRRAAPAPRSSRDDDGGDGADGNGNTVTVALTCEAGGNGELRAALADHPVVGMMGVTLDVREMPCVAAGGGGDEEGGAPVEFSEDRLSAMDGVDMACFMSSSALTSWLHNIDVAKGYEGMEDEEKRKLGPEGNGNVVASCADKDLAKTCLETGRWEARNIYYPAKDTESLTWADSAAMAIGDIMERKFWGGGW